MSTDNSKEFGIQEQTLDQGEQIQRLLYRVLPFWPLIILAIGIAVAGARIYLRYQTPIYSAKARLIVNDESQQKGANLQEIIKLDNRNLSSETEREVQVLISRDLLTKLAIKRQLNVIYIQQGVVTTAQYYNENTPFKLELKYPDSVRGTYSGQAEMIGNQISFDGQLYPLDTFMNSRMGQIRWVLNNSANNIYKVKKLQLSIVPVSVVVGQMKASLGVAPISKQSSILDLVYYDVIPERGISVLNSLIALYGSLAVEYKSRIYQNAEIFLDERIRLIADELNGVEKNLQAFQSSEGVADLGREADLYLAQSKENLRKLGEIEVQQDVLNEIEKYVTQRNKASNAIPATLGISDPVLNGLLNQLYEAESELEKTRQTSGDKNPQIEVYEELVKRLKPSISKSIENLKINLKASKNQLQREYDEMNGSLTKIPYKQRMLLDITRQQAIKNAIYTFLLQKREESAIAAASVLPNYRVIEKPEPAGIVYPDPKKIYTISVLMALLVVLIYIYLKEFSSKRLLFRAQIENILPIPVISELIFHPHDPVSPVVVGAGKRTLVAEQFRELRTNINYITAGSKEKCKVILTTSSIPKEGKSFVAINAAISLSLTGDKVVLLEFDLRKPKISKPLGITRDPGLSNYLIGKATEEEVIKPHSSIENLYVIPSGPIPPNPAELLSGPRLLDLITYLKSNFDYIVIDSPPVAAVTDAKILANVADATIYIVRHNYTNFVFLNLINDIYQKKGLPNINIVFNGIVNKRIMGYNYGKGYGYGYGYGYSNGYGYGYTDEEAKKKGGIIKWIKAFFSKILGNG
jgi:tyrosine-protein kinase Etk/Wzc